MTVPSHVDIAQALRQSTDGWSGDAFAVDAEIAVRGAKEIERLRGVLKDVASMIPSQISPGFVHGPQLLLDNCQRLARKALRDSRKA